MRPGSTLRHKVWLGVFFLWAFVLTGIISLIPASQTATGNTPGFMQAYRLKMLLTDREDEAKRLHSEIESLEERLVLLQSDRGFQEREIRKVLGYAAPDELVFDFSDRDQL